MRKGDIETFYEDGEWHNRVEGEGGLRGTYDGRHEAVSEGRRMAQDRQAWHVITNIDGTNAGRYNYGHASADAAS
jgi:hypothetical protein